MASPEPDSEFVVLAREHVHWTLVDSRSYAEKSRVQLGARSQQHRSTASSFGQSDFKHEPLEDAAAQIRLLRLCSTPAGRGDGARASELRCELETWKLADVPSYVAASYTWGSAIKSHRILIGGRGFAITANAHYALSQIECHPETELVRGLIWMDGICIDQENLEEKAKQVGLMGEIYSRSHCAFACVGPAEKDSDFLFSFVEETLEAGPDEQGRWTSAQINAALEKVVPVRSEQQAFCLRFAKASGEFANRNYWSRMWILQELWLSDNTWILCGEKAMLLSEFVMALHCMPLWDHELPEGSPWADQPQGEWDTRPSSVREYLWNSKMDSLMESGMWKARKNGYGAVSLAEVMKLAGRADCSDFRDKLFGLINVTRWRDDPPVPDYNLTRAELALTVAKLTSPSIFGTATDAMKALPYFTYDIGLSESEFDAHMRRTRSPSDADADTGTAEIPSTVEKGYAVYQGFNLSDMPFTPREFTLMAHMEGEEDLGFNGAIGYESYVETRARKAVRIDGAVISLVTPEARGGDWLLVREDFGFDNRGEMGLLGLIARRDGSVATDEQPFFRIVGWAITNRWVTCRLHDKRDFCSVGGTSRYRAEARFEVWWDPVDLVRQELIRREVDMRKFDDGARLARVLNDRVARTAWSTFARVHRRVMTYEEEENVDWSPWEDEDEHLPIFMRYVA